MKHPLVVAITMLPVLCIRLTGSAYSSRARAYVNLAEVFSPQPCTYIDVAFVLTAPLRLIESGTSTSNHHMLSEGHLKF